MRKIYVIIIFFLGIGKVAICQNFYKIGTDSIFYDSLVINMDLTRVKIGEFYNLSIRLKITNESKTIKLVSNPIFDVEKTFSFINKTVNDREVIFDTRKDPLAHSIFTANSYYPYSVDSLVINNQVKKSSKFIINFAKVNYLDLAPKERVEYYLRLPLYSNDLHLIQLDFYISTLLEAGRRRVLRTELIKI